MLSVNPYATATVATRGLNTDRRAIASRWTGRQLVDTTSSKRTYSSSFSLVVAASATDIVEVKGAANIRAEITKIIIGGVQTTAGQVVVDLIRRSTANTAGTSTAPVGVKHDVADAAAAVTLKAYTANPSALGTVVGTIRRARVPINVATGVTGPTEFKFGGDGEGKPIVLEAALQFLCINLAGVTVTGGTLDITVEWTEVG